MLPGNTSDKTTLRAFLHKIETQYGKAQRIWVMDRGIPTEDVLAEMRAAEPPVSYLVGTPKGRLTVGERNGASDQYAALQVAMVQLPPEVIYSPVPTMSHAHIALPVRAISG